MAIAELNGDRYKYLEDRIKEKGGVEHLEESDEWFLLSGSSDGGLFDHPYWDVYMHRTRFFKASVYFNIEDAESEEEAYETDATGEEYTGRENKVRKEPQSIKVSFCRPKHHYDEEEELPPIHEVYSKDPAEGDR